jgi:hypothetical protein
MPEFRGQVTAIKLMFNKKTELLKWMVRNAGLWFVLTIKILGKSKDRKTREQLGYYWGLLLPELHDQYLREGFTVTVRVARVKIGNKSLEVEREPTMDDSHELNKDVCGLIGENGKRMDVRDMGKQEVRKFIDNVIDHAVINLKMNGETLRAERPTL